MKGLRSKMKAVLVLSAILGADGFAIAEAQNKTAPNDSLSVALRIGRSECPPLLLTALSEDLLQHKAALFIINYSSHPLGKTEFRDNLKPVKDLKIPIRMNRVTLLYIDSGMHRFHTMYQQKFKEVNFQPGDIFIAALTSRSVWPLPFVLVREDEKGEEFGPVLLHYITAAAANELLLKIKKKEVTVNPSVPAQLSKDLYD